MFIVHPDTKSLQEVIFQVTSHEGGVIVSCATSIELGLIQHHRNLDVVPEEGSLLYSIADMPKKQKNKNYQAEKCVHMQPKKPATDVQSEISAMLIQHNKVQKSNKKEDDKNCQEIKRPRKPRNVMQSVTKEIHIQLAKPEIRRLCSDKNCQSIWGYKNMSPRRPMYD